MNIGIISDTHGLLRPEAVDALRGSELIIHAGDIGAFEVLDALRSEEHTSELQSLMRISYAVFCLKKKKYNHHKTYPTRLTVKHNVDQETINRSDKLT